MTSTPQKKLISIVTPCYNEEDNIEALSLKIAETLAPLADRYNYEHIIIDNASTDTTQTIVKRLALNNKKIKAIFNARNFGHIRSPYHGMLQGQGDATILAASDFQDPLEMLPKFIEQWEQGYKVVMGVKHQSEETPLMFLVRKIYYNLSAKLSDIKLVKNYTGFGLYDKEVIDTLRTIQDPYPYFRGLIADLGFSSTQLLFRQPNRKRGITKNNFYTLYDMAMLGITNHSRIPLRLATMLGFAMSALSLLLALGYLIAKLLFWSRFPFGTAPLIISVFFFSSVQLFFIGILGEYIGAIYTQVQNRPHVIEKERINF